MSPEHDLAIEFADLASRLRGSNFQVTLNEVLNASLVWVEADLGGVMLARGRRVESAAVTDDLVLRADELQLEAGDGPCLEAIEDRDTFVVVDTATETRWPAWCREVAGLGIRSVLSIRLQTAAGVLGALNLYSRRAGAFSREDQVVATILATHASVALAADKERDELQRAVDGRHMIGMAQGILMERFKLNAEEAFSVLRRYSQDRNVKLREVASQLVQSRVLPA